jgi:hypothetical protein
MNSAAVETYANRFYGYGSWKHPIWFVGMEEGGCASLKDFNQRLIVWLQRGCQELEDAKPYHEAIGLGKWFQQGARLQQTWEKLIRIFLSFQNLPSDTEAVRKFQTTEFGRQDRGFASLELFSLPSTSTQSWVYSDVPDLSYLINREVYKYYLYPRRAEELRRRISIHKPKHVVIYGLDYRHEWEGIVMQKFQQSDLESAIETRLNGTLVLVVPHPVSYGRKQSYWSDVGRYLRKNS